MNWISVKDKLPFNEQNVIFWQFYKNKTKGVVKIGKFWANTSRNKPCFTSINSFSHLNEGLVTHWQPVRPPNQEPSSK